MSTPVWIWLGSFLAVAIGAALCFRSKTKQGRQYELGYMLLSVGVTGAFIAFVQIAFP